MCAELVSVYTTWSLVDDCLRQSVSAKLSGAWSGLLSLSDAAWSTLEG